MKKISTLVFCFFCSIALLAQPFGDEWIVPEQTYYKIKVSEDGLYRVNYDVLSGLDLPLMGSGYQLYRDGQQIPLLVSATGTLGTADYLEFYGYANDGALDTELYASADWQPQVGRSLFTDEATYFLSWSDDSENLRFELTTNDLTGAPAIEAYFWKTNTTYFKDDFHKGKPSRTGGENIYFADFGECEGWVSDEITAGNSITFAMNGAGLYDAGPSSQIEVKIVGRSDDFLILGDHPVLFTVESVPFGSISFDGFNSDVYSVTVPNAILSAPNILLKVEASDMMGSSNKISIASAAFIFPHGFDMEEVQTLFIELEDHANRHIRLENVELGATPVVYDLTGNLWMTAVEEAGQFHFNLPEIAGATGKRKLFVTTSTEAPVLNTVSEVENVQFINFNDAANQGNYLIVTHSSLQNTPENYPQAYADYRQSTEGGGHSSVLVNIETLYDQFAWGIDKHPLAIRHFVNKAVADWGIAPEFLLLLGKGVSYDQFVAVPDAYDNCLVPTFGDVASDYWLGVNNPADYLPQVAIGRISATTPEDVRAYLEKIMVYEATQNASCGTIDKQWMKNVMHLIQAPSASTADWFEELLMGYEPLVETSIYGGNMVGTFVQPSNMLVSFPEIFSLVNDGLGLIHFLGSSAEGTPGYWAFDFQVPFAYSNEGRYPFIISDAGFSGHIFSSETQRYMADDYVLADARGAIGFLGLTGIGFPTVLDTYNLSLYSQFTSDNYGGTMGQNIINTIDHIYIPDPEALLHVATKATVQSLAYAGDPAMRLFVADLPDFAVSDYQAELFAYVPDAEFSVFAVVNNEGAATGEPYTVTITQTLPDGSMIDIYEEEFIATGAAHTIDVDLFGSYAPGEHIITISVDSPNAVVEECEDNNIASQVLEMGCLDSFAFIDVEAAYCLNEGSITLTAEPSGGVFSSPTLSIVGNTVDLTMAPLGENFIAYSYDDGACIWSGEAVVTINPNPVVSLGDTLILQPGSSLTLDAGGINLEYEWSTGADTQNIEVTTEGWYSVTITDTNGCTDSDDVFVMSVVGIDAPIAAAIQVYPNPVSGVLHIELPTSILQNTSIQLLDVTGRLLKSETASAGTHYMDVSQLAQGMYLLKVWVAGEMVKVEKVFVD